MRKKTTKADKPTRPDVLGAIDALGVPDRTVEDEASVPHGFLSKARKGDNAGERASSSWAKLERWLASRKVDLAPSRPVLGQHAELVEMIRAASTLESVDALHAFAHEELVRGVITPSIARVLIDGLKERRQVLAAIVEERARVDSDKPVTVRVEYVNDWKGAPACEACGGTGRTPGQESAA
jgi:hypothetical protein